jgi:hypothetical protein
MQLGGQGGDGIRSGVRFDLGNARGTGYHGGDGIMVKNPPQGELGHGQAFGKEGFQPLGKLDSLREWDSREGFANVE